VRPNKREKLSRGGSSLEVEGGNGTYLGRFKKILKTVKKWVFKKGKFEGASGNWRKSHEYRRLLDRDTSRLW